MLGEKRWFGSQKYSRLPGDTRPILRVLLFQPYCYAGVKEGARQPKNLAGVQSVVLGNGLRNLGFVHLVPKSYTVRTPKCARQPGWAFSGGNTGPMGRVHVARLGDCTIYSSSPPIDSPLMEFGGRRRIRTFETCYGLAAFKTPGIVHSPSLPFPLCACRATSVYYPKECNAIECCIQNCIQCIGHLQ